MLRLRISCVEKDDHDNVHEQIKLIGGRYAGIPWRLCTANAIKLIERGRYSFYVSDGDRETDVVIAIKNGRKYLRTLTDGEFPEELLALPECKK